MILTDAIFGKKKTGSVTVNHLWKLEENVVDNNVIFDSIGGVNGTNFGATIQQAGKFGKSYRFNGNSRADLLPANYFSGSFSFGCWFKWAGTGFQTILTTRTSGNGLNISTRDGSQFFLRFQANGVYSGPQFAVTPFNDGLWHLTTGYFNKDAGQWGVFYDEEIVYEAQNPAWVGQNAIGSIPLTLAQKGVGSWTGNLDEVFVKYDNISFEEHLAMWNEGNGINL